MNNFYRFKCLQYETSVSCFLHLIRENLSYCEFKNLLITSFGFWKCGILWNKCTSTYILILSSRLFHLQFATIYLMKVQFLLFAKMAVLERRCKSYKIIRSFLGIGMTVINNILNNYSSLGHFVVSAKFFQSAILHKFIAALFI
jgi:hypothetical protein